MQDDAPSNLNQAALKRAEAALRVIATTANHDLNAPLRHIQVFSELLGRDRGEALGEEGQAYLDHVQNATGRLSALIERLVDYARIVSTPVQGADLDLSALANEVAARIEAGITVAALPNAYGDRALIGRVFSELMTNAAIHAPGSAVSVTGRKTKTGAVEIQIADTGPGIAADYAETVFEFLGRPPPADPQNPGGAGLAICRHIIESHGGAIHLDTEAAAGAVFVFTLLAASNRDR